MLGWLKSLFTPPEPAGPPRRLRGFGPSDRPLTQDGVTVDQNALRIESRDTRTVLLFEIPEPGVEQAILTYRARVRTADLQGGAYLEMWCRFPGRGEFFSRGLHHVVKGTTEWSSSEIPFFLKKGQRPDLIKLNVAVQGRGTLWISDVELLATPLR